GVELTAGEIAPIEKHAAGGLQIKLCIGWHWRRVGEQGRNDAGYAAAHGGLERAGSNMAAAIRNRFHSSSRIPPAAPHCAQQRRLATTVGGAMVSSMTLARAPFAATFASDFPRPFRPRSLPRSLPRSSAGARHADLTGDRTRAHRRAILRRSFYARVISHARHFTCASFHTPV